MKKHKLLLLIFVPFALLLVSCQQALAPQDTPANPTLIPSTPPVPEVYDIGARVRYCTSNYCLILELLQDGLLHGEYAIEGTKHDLTEPIWTSPMINKIDYAEPINFSLLEDGSLVTDDLRVGVDAARCFTAVDTTRTPQWQMTHICPTDMTDERSQISIESPDITDIYGLGQLFLDAGVSDGPKADGGSAHPTWSESRPVC